MAHSNDDHDESIEMENPLDPNVVNHNYERMRREMEDMIESATERNRVELETMLNQRVANDLNHSNYKEELKKMKAELKEKQKEIDRLKNKNECVSFDKFKRSGTTPFDGTIDPVSSMQWIRDTEKVFRVSKCLDADKVEYATSLFTKDALDWWSNIYDFMTEENRNMLTWDIFKDKFTAQYCPTDLQNRYATEFMELKQGNMSVTAYVAEFNRKSKFAADILPTEARKVERFIQGLRLDIQEPLYGRKFTTLEEAVSNARNREHMLERIAAEAMQTSKNARIGNFSGQAFLLGYRRSHSEGQNPDTHFSKCNKRKREGVFYKKNNESEGSHSVRTIKPSIKCFQCGDSGHMSTQCSKNATGCYECGAAGHDRKDCPRLSEFGAK